MSRYRINPSQSQLIGNYAFLKLVFILAIVLLINACSKDDDPSVNYDAPTSLEVIKIANGKVQLTWQYSSQSTNIVYIVARKEGSGSWNETYYESTNDQKLFIDDIPTNSYTVYSYKVKAKEVDTSNESFFSNPASYFPDITQPTDLRIYQTSQNQLKITWVDNAEGESGYKIDKKIDNGAWVKAYASLSENVETYTDEVNQLYQNISYRVYAYVGASTSPSNELTFTPTIQIPDSLRLNQISSNQIKLNWQYNGELPNLFEVQRKIGTNDWALLTQVNGSQTHYIDNLSIESATLNYRVRSKKDTLYSAYSDVSSINFNISELSSINLSNHGNQVFVKDNYLFIANDYNGTLIYNTANPTNPSLIKNISMPGRTLSVTVDENVLYMANDQGIMQVYDISSIDNPVKLYDDVQFYGQGNHICITEINFQKYALVSAGSSGLKIIAFNMTNIPVPVVIKTINTVPGANVFKSVVSNNTVYLAEGINGIRQFDISDPFNPVFLRHKQGIGTIVDISLTEQYLYLGRGDLGIALLTTSNLNMLSEFDTQGYSNSIDIDSRNVYIADRDEGFLIVSAINPAQLISICKLDTTSNVLSIVIKNKYAYLSSQNYCKIIQIRP